MRALAVAVVAGALLAVAPAGAADGAVAAAAKQCRKGKVPVKVNGKRRCRPARQALPKPRAGDPRRSMAQSVYRTSWSGLRTRTPSLPKLIRKVGRRAPALLLRATARGLARLDALPASARATAVGCGGPSRSDSFTSKGGDGTSAQVTATLGADGAGMEVELSGHGMTVKVDLDFGCEPGDVQAPRCATAVGRLQGDIRYRLRASVQVLRGGDGTSAQVTATLGPDGAGMEVELSGQGMTVKVDLDFGCEPGDVQAPRCPTAVGRLQGDIRYRLRASVQVLRGGRDVWSQAVDITRKTELDGWNEVDAKLERLDVEDIETSKLRLGGSVRGFPPIAIRSKVVRRTRVDMRSGAFEPDRSDISVTVDTAGLGGPERSEVEDDIAERSRAQADQQFRAIVEKAISGYRSREAEWQEPRCAELRLSPASNSRTLRAGEPGSFTATAIAKQDGSPSELDARLSGPVNASFEPTRAGGQQARFGYTVTSAPSGGKVQAKVRATSKAGVAEGTWEQPLKPPLEVERIAGNFSGVETIAMGGRITRVSWTGAASFQATPPGMPGAAGGYILQAGQVTYTFSGGDILGEACDMSGTMFVDLVQHGAGDFAVFPLGSQFDEGPHTYSGGIAVGPTALVTYTLSNCADSDLNGKTRTIPVAQGGFAPLQIPSTSVSPDGIHYNGTGSEAAAGVAVEWNWALTGAK